MPGNNYYGKGGRPSFRKPSRFSAGAPSRFRGGGRPSYGGSRPRSRAPMPERIDYARFIHKPEHSPVDEYVNKHTFADFALHPNMKEAVKLRGYVTPTPIQDSAIPHILEGRDVVGIANTGTGKTGAFLIPLLNKVGMNIEEKVLVIVPTRELALQIQEEFRGFARHLRLFSVCVVGGAPIGRQISDLRREHNFVIGTPGRIKDLVERDFINLSEFNTVVLDEADRMLDMGFINEMRDVMAAMPKERQTLFFSATLSRKIEGLIHEFLNDPVRVSVKTGDTSKNVEQDVVRIKKGDIKIDVLHQLLSQEEFKKILIFGETKHGVERLSKILSERGFKVESIHGNKNQSQRKRALSNFKDDRSNVLVATDVAARGLDITGVTHVINYDIPRTYDDYVHRIGRTGRSDQKGKALTFVE